MSEWLAAELFDAGAMTALLAILIVAANRLPTRAGLYAAQSAFLAVGLAFLPTPLPVALTSFAVVTGIFKCVLITQKLNILAHRYPSRATSNNAPAGLLTAIAVLVVAHLAFGSLSTPAVFPYAVSTILLGLFMAASHRQHLVQLMGLLVAENGLALAAVSVASASPLVLGIVISFEWILLAVVLGLSTERFGDRLLADRIPGAPAP